MNRESYVFDFERLEVYKMGIEFVREMYKITEELPIK